MTKCTSVSYYLTGESILRAAAAPFPPTSNTPTVIRFVHSNSYGPIDSEVFVRLGDPTAPLDIADFDTVSDWMKAKLTGDKVWSEEKDEWVPRPKKIIGETAWEATYEAVLRFPPGKQVIEIKFLSSMEHVCSIVLSNWVVNVK